MHQADALAALGLVQVSRGDKCRYALPNQMISDSPKLPPGDRVNTERRLV